jgi:hypothetical protein
MNYNKDDLLKEYDIIISQMTRFESNIWITASLFNIGSIIGIIEIIKNFSMTYKFVFSLFIISFIAINMLLIWYRLSKRWWSLFDINKNKLQTLENQLGFGYTNDINIYDNKVMRYRYHKRLNGNIFSKFYNLILYNITKEIKDSYKPNEFIEIDNNLKNYEYRGIRPVIKLFSFINIIIWLSLPIFTIIIFKFKSEFDKVKKFFENLSINQFILLSIIIFIIIILISLFEIIFFFRKP